MDLLAQPMQARKYGDNLLHLLRTQYTVQRAWQRYKSLIDK
jgi:hypothetical protein